MQISAALHDEDELSDVQGVLEDYLKRESLLSFIPKHRLAELFSSFSGTLLFLSLMVIGGFVLSAFSRHKLIAAAFAPLTTFVILFLVIVIWAIIRGLRLKSDAVFNEKNLVFIGTLILIVWPLSTSVMLGILYKNIIAVLIYLVYSGIILAIVFNIQRNPGLPHKLFEPFKAAVRSFADDLRVLIRALPILIVLVLLSVFNLEYWQALSELRLLALGLVVLLILLPIIVLFPATLHSEAEKLIPQQLSWNEVLEVVENSEFMSMKLRQGLLSHEVWERLKQQGAWRHMYLLQEKYWKPTLKRTKQWLRVTLIVISILLLIVSTLYFYLLFLLLLPEDFKHLGALANVNTRYLTIIASVYDPAIR
jgi:hypothetical protein